MEQFGWGTKWENVEQNTYMINLSKNFKIFAFLRSSIIVPYRNVQNNLSKPFKINYFVLRNSQFYRHKFYVTSHNFV